MHGTCNTDRPASAPAPGSAGTWATASRDATRPTRRGVAGGDAPPRVGRRLSACDTTCSVRRPPRGPAPVFTSLLPPDAVVPPTAPRRVMSALGLALLAQLSAITPAAALVAAQPPAAPPRAVAPVLAFPEAGLDDSAAYQGYQTRLFRDAAGNTVQAYLDARQGRVGHVLADADDESAAFTARDARGRPVALRWDGPGATVSRQGRLRTLEYRLSAEVPVLAIGQFLLGSMRVERDFQYERAQGRGNASMRGPAYPGAEVGRLLTALGGLDATERRRHLATLHAGDVAALRARTRPTVTAGGDAAGWVARVVQPSLDGRDTVLMELRADPGRVDARLAGDSLVLRVRPGAESPVVPFTVRVATTGAALTPMTRAEIFRPEFLAFLEGARADTALGRGRLMERQALGVELLASREKLMAGLPTYATYFGRDLMVSALMMRDVWRPDVLEAVVGSVLRNLAPDGQVSHEEALGGQAVREAAAEYADLLGARGRALGRGDRRAADSLLAAAHGVLGAARRTRQNYHMVDDEFQLPVLAARWLADPGVSAERKRAFLLDASDASPANGGGTRLARLVRELGVVARWSAPYAARPEVQNLVAFGRRDSTRWASASWRDSGAGYANGRFAMDVNAVWVPHALEATGRILAALRALGLPAGAPAGRSPGPAANSPLGTYLRDSTALRRAVETWRGAERHFVVRLDGAGVRARVAARLAAMPATERVYWTRLTDGTAAARDSLAFLAVALDSAGVPIGVANTDPATRLFLGEVGRPDGAGAAAGNAAADSAALRDVRLFARDYPAGLFVARVGPAVANDVYAAPAVWRAFDQDPYHGPKVVWGREVNLFLLGVADRITAAGDAPGRAAYVRELRSAFDRVRGAADAAGFKSELWSYEVRDGRAAAVRYGSGNDVQLWTTTDLAVQFARSRLPK